MVTKILTPFYTLRIIGLAIYDWIHEKMIQIVVYLPTLFNEPFSSGMPAEPGDIISIPFKPYHFNLERTKFFYYNLVNYNDINHIFEDVYSFPQTVGPRTKTVKDVWDIFTPVKIFSHEKIPRITWQGPANNPLSFYIEPFWKMRFLPDDVERFLYNWLGETYDADLLHFICSDFAAWLCLYGAMFGVRSSFQSSLTSFNPFAWKPTAALQNLYDPWLDRAFKWFPKPWSLPAHYPFFFGIVKNVDFTLQRITFSGPFLPSEGVFTTERVDNTNRTLEALYFHGFPAMWKSGIPNFERLNWYERNPEVYDYIIKNHHDMISNIIILPDHIIQ